MYLILMVVIYLSFIGLGLPDSLLGSAWPSMYGQLGTPVSSAGLLSMIITGGTIISSLFSDRLIRRMGTGLLTAASVCMTALALLGFSLSNTFLELCLWAIPYGLGAGSVDSALNNFAALHFKSKHMNWLHCFWGIGAAMGPYIMGYCLSGGYSWKGGYFSVGVLQAILTLLLFLMLPLWKKGAEVESDVDNRSEPVAFRTILKLPGAKPVLAAFFCYSALEITTGLWAGSYLVLSKGIPAVAAAKWASLFYFGITAGRLAGGFVIERLGDKKIVRLGQLLIGAGALMMAFLPGQMFALWGLFLAGAGCAPIYPSLLHQTPEHFGVKMSQAVMGMQVACAYMGSTLMPPLFGLIAEGGGIHFFPWYLVTFVCLMTFMVERVNHKSRAEKTMH